jgi:hypothetical protein
MEPSIVPSPQRLLYNTERCNHLVNTMQWAGKCMTRVHWGKRCPKAQRWRRCCGKTHGMTSHNF